MRRCLIIFNLILHGSPRPLLLSYQRLLQTISVLEAQRTQAILDLEALARHQKQALTNPVAFVDQLQKQVRCSSLRACVSKDSCENSQYSGFCTHLIYIHVRLQDEITGKISIIH